MSRREVKNVSMLFRLFMMMTYIFLPHTHDLVEFGLGKTVEEDSSVAVPIRKPWAIIVDPSHTTDARMMTTLLIVFPKACVTGATL